VDVIQHNARYKLHHAPPQCDPQLPSSACKKDWEGTQAGERLQLARHRHCSYTDSPSTPARPIAPDRARSPCVLVMMLPSPRPFSYSRAQPADRVRYSIVRSMLSPSCSRAHDARRGQCTLAASSPHPLELRLARSCPIAKIPFGGARVPMDVNARKRKRRAFAHRRSSDTRDTPSNALLRASSPGARKTYPRGAVMCARRRARRERRVRRRFPVLLAKGKRKNSNECRKEYTPCESTSATE
jgi:hypothetical protein